MRLYDQIKYDNPFKPYGQSDSGFAKNPTSEALEMEHLLRSSGREEVSNMNTSAFAIYMGALNFLDIVKLLVGAGASFNSVYKGAEFLPERLADMMACRCYHEKKLRTEVLKALIYILQHSDVDASMAVRGDCLLESYFLSKRADYSAEDKEVFEVLVRKTSRGVLERVALRLNEFQNSFFRDKDLYRGLSARLDEFLSRGC
jgi:hypothetical protein